MEGGEEMNEEIKKKFIEMSVFEIKIKGESE